jgi:uncharacterized protein RhaS with RHS repeats
MAMYDPGTGRWLSQDPLGFEAGDVNLYRYVKNRPTNASDPSGLDGIGDGIANSIMRNELRRMQQIQMQIGDDYRARIVFDHNTQMTDNERQRVRRAFSNAAERIRLALLMLDDNWEETTRLYRFTTVFDDDGNGRQIESMRWRQINDNRQLLLDRLRQVYQALRTSSTQIFFSNRSQETHVADNNSMYTALVTDLNGNEYRQVRARSTFWRLNAGGVNSQAYWTTHELARYFLWLDDDVNLVNRQGVQQWDQGIETLNDWYFEWRGGHGIGGDW